MLLAVKTLHWQQLPWHICAIAHHDRQIARAELRKRKRQFGAASALCLKPGRCGIRTLQLVARMRRTRASTIGCLADSSTIATKDRKQTYMLSATMPARTLLSLLALIGLKIT